MQSDGRMKAAMRRARTGGGMKLDTNSLSDTFSEQYLSVFQVTVCIVLFYSELKKHLDVFSEQCAASRGALLSDEQLQPDLI